MPLRDVIFDLDGTLVDSKPGIERAAVTAVARVWPDRAPVPIAPLIGPPIRAMLAAAYPDATEADLDALVAEFRAAYDGGDWRHTTPYPGLVEVLDAIGAAGGRAFVVTNKRHQATQLILAHLGVAERFTATRAPEDPAMSWSGKADALAALVASHDISPGAAAYVGDSPDDRAAARTAGIPFIAASYGYGTAGREPDPADLALVNSLSSLIGFLSRDEET
jgi:phosphoglycolate phosphatase